MVMNSISQEENIQEFLVDTPETNHAAVKFLESLGFSSPIKQVYMTINFRKKEDLLPEAGHKRPMTLDPVYFPNKKVSHIPCSLPKNINDSVTVREMTLDDIWDVFQIGEQVFTSKSLNLYRFWDEVSSFLHNEKENLFLSLTCSPESSYKCIRT